MSAAATASVDVDAVVALVHTAVRGEIDERAVCVAGIDASERLMAWAEAQRLRFVAGMGSDEDADDALTRHNRSSSSQARKTRTRAATAEQAPAVAEELASGNVTSEHLDLLGESLRRLGPDQQQQLLAEQDDLAGQAATMSAGEFAKYLKMKERDLGREVGIDQLKQQRSMVRLRSWVDRITGMCEYRLSLDPERGVKLTQAINALTETLFHGDPIEDCPTDPEERYAFLRAHALLALLDGKGGKPGRPEILVVVDATAPGKEPQVDWGLPVELPLQVLHDLFGVADITTVVVRNGIILHAPGKLDLGRDTRLANRAQRRALRALYSTCMIPGCTTPFDGCQIHHIQPWEHGGRTDLDSLGPLCNPHHHAAHHHGWIITLGPNRQITIITPNGTIHGPPPGRSP